MSPLTKQRLDLLGTICGVMGVALLLLALILRFSSLQPADLFISPRSVLLGSIAITVFGCWLKLEAR